MSISKFDTKEVWVLDCLLLCTLFYFSKHMFALLKPSCAIYNYRYIFRVLLQDSTCCREFTVLHEDARILLHTTTAQLDVYASQVLQFSLRIIVNTVYYFTIDYSVLIFSTTIWSSIALCNYR